MRYRTIGTAVQVYGTEIGRWVDADNTIPLVLKLSGIGQRVDNFIRRLNNEWSTSIRASVIAESQGVADPDRLLLCIHAEVSGRNLRFNSGYLNRKTNRYNKANYADAVNLNEKNDSAAFGVIRQKTAEILGIREWWEVAEE